MKRIVPLFLLLAVLITACAPAATPTAAPAPTEAPAQAQPTITAEPTATAAPAASPVLFTIVKADGSKFEVTLDAVKKLPSASLTVEGKVQEGPKLMDVLALAGVTDFSEVTLNGSGSSTLTRDQVDNKTILDFSNRGTMKLATTYIPKANWAKDITEIVVK